MGQAGNELSPAWQNRLTAADTVTETDILDLYDGAPPEVTQRPYRAIWQRGRTATSGWCWTTP